MNVNEIVSPLLRKLTEQQNLTRHEAEEAFVTLERDDTDCYHYFAFLAALHTKGETAEELQGFCDANARFVDGFEVGCPAEEIVDCSGTGGDRLNTANVSTAASFVAAAGGMKVAKQAFLAVTGVSGSADLLQSFGVDPLRLSREGESAVKKVFSEQKMVIYHANSMAEPSERRGYFEFWLKRVPETKLAFVTAYHLAANVYSPMPMARRVYGVFGEKYLRPLGELFQRLGYVRALVCHGVDGLDELSNVGPTKIVELRDGKLVDYEVTPEDMGVPRAKVGDISATTRDRNIQDFVRIIYGKEVGPKADLVSVNAGGIFYVMEKAESIGEGVEIAKSLVKKGAVAERFERYVEGCGDTARLSELKKAAGV